MQLQPRLNTLEVENVRFVAGESDDQWVLVLEKGIVADRTAIFRLQRLFGYSFETLGQIISMTFVISMKGSYQSAIRH
jgi:hypothetical protein